MIIMTMAELLEARGGAQELAELEVPMQMAFDVSDLLREIDGRLRIYEQQRAALFLRFGDEREATEAERRATGNLRVRVIRAGEETAFAEQMNDLLRVTVEIDRSPIRLTTTNGLKIKPRILFALGAFVQAAAGEV